MRDVRSFSDLPTVSVEIITHNRANLLKHAIQSVLNQTYQDFEIIVVDDGSTDNIWEVVESFSDYRIRYIRHEQRRGGAAARNTGVQAARGKYMAFLDDDDEWLPKKLELQISRIRESPENVALIYTGSRHISNGQTVKTLIPRKRGCIFEDMLYGNCTGNASTLLVRMSVFSKVGLFDENKLRGVDSGFIRQVSKDFKVDFVDEVLVNVSVDSPNRTTPVDTVAENKKCIKAIQYVLDKFSEDFRRFPRARAHRYFQLARHAYDIYAKNNDSSYRKTATRFTRKGLVLDFNFKMLVFGLAINVPGLWKVINFLHKHMPKLED